MRRALDLDVPRYALLRRNLWITLSSAPANVGTTKGPEFTHNAVEIAQSSGLGGLRVAEALSDNSISLWKVGRRDEGFLVWEKAVNRLVNLKSGDESWIKAFLAFLHASGYFASMALYDTLPKPGYAPPEPGFFLAYGNLPIERYRPVQESLLLLRTAMFAEGVLSTRAAAYWTGLALRQKSELPGALKAFGWLLIAQAILDADYVTAIQEAHQLEKLDITKGLADLEEVGSERDRERFSVEFSRKNRATYALLLGVIPIAFRLATLKYDKDISNNLSGVILILNTVDRGRSSDWQRAGQELSLVLSGGKSWNEFHSNGSAIYPTNPALGILYFLGSALVAPLQQSLATQIWLGQQLESIFKVNRSLAYAVLLPFFVRFWDEALIARSAEFRTSASYARRVYNDAIAGPICTRLRRLLGSMVFCLGIPPSVEAQEWLDC